MSIQQFNYLYTIKQIEIMTTIISNEKFTVQFNGSKTYFVNQVEGDCIRSFETEKKAINYFNKISK